MNINIIKNLIDHIVFPIKLPTSFDDSFNDYFFIVTIDALKSIKSDLNNNEILDDFFSEKLEKIKNLLDSWSKIQQNQLDGERIHENGLNTRITIKEQTDFSSNSNKNQKIYEKIIALYLKHLNACILVHLFTTPNEKSSKEYEKATFSYFKASLNNEEIMSNVSSDYIEETFPTETIYIDNLDILCSRSFANMLADMGNNACEENYALSKKSGIDNEEVRDVENIHMISDWLCNFLASNIEIPFVKHSILDRKIKKKVRDEINLQNDLMPFRRSGLWMSIKAILQLEFEHLFKDAGLVFYKLIMIRILESLCSKSFTFNDDDLNIQIIRKLARRVYKLSILSKTIAINSTLRDFIEKSLEQCENTIKSVRQLMNSNMEKIISFHSEWQSTKLDLKKINHSDYKYKRENMRSLIDQINNLKNKRNTGLINQTSKNEIFFVPRNLNFGKNALRLFQTEYLQTKEDDLQIHLYDTEECLFDLYLKVKRNFAEEEYDSLFEILQNYYQKATLFYKRNNVNLLGRSRMVLMCLIIIVIFDQTTSKQYPMLLEYRIGLDVKILEYLLFSKSKEVVIVKHLKEYIEQRNINALYTSSLFEINLKQKSFGARFSKQCNEMQLLKEKIKCDANNERNEKRKEIDREFENYKKLIKQAGALSCECCHRSTCTRCLLLRRAKSIKVDIHEWPLPSDEYGEDLVMFEMRIPKIISYLRDAIYILYKQILLLGEEVDSVKYSWLSELSKYDPNQNQQYVALGSSVKSFKTSHYSNLSISHTKNDYSHYFKPNGFNLKLYGKISSSLLDEFSDIGNFKDDLNNMFTFKLTDSSYKILQWSLYHDKRNSENKVIADQYNCPKDLSLREFIKFGCFRCGGHRLQLRNLLDCLETRNLPLNNQSVFFLISQSLWQVGPLEGLNDHLYDAKNDIFYPSSHLDLSNDGYLMLLINLLDAYLVLVEKKWNEYFIIYNLIIIIQRAISFSASQEIITTMIAFQRKIRQVTNEWQVTLNKIIANNFVESQNIDNEPSYIKCLQYISCLSLLTFSSDERYTSRLMENDDDIYSWLISMDMYNKYKGRRSLDENEEKVFETLLNQITITSLQIAQQYFILVNKCNGEVLTKFVKNLWPDINDGYLIQNKWKPLEHNQKNQEYPLWFCAEFIPNDKNKANVTLHLSIKARFLVDGSPIGKLPSNIIEHEDYKRFFESHEFDVSQGSDGPGSFVTSILTQQSDETDMSFSFYLNNKDLIIKEKTSSEAEFYEERQLIPHKLFEPFFPISFIENYSHWLYKKNDNKYVIEFRTKTYHKYCLNSKQTVQYFFHLDDLTLFDEYNTRFLIDINSSTSKEISKKLTNRLDDSNYVHVFIETNDENSFLVKLTRLNLSFKIDVISNCAWSNDFKNMMVSEAQNMNTMIGLKKGILLCEKLNDNNQNQGDQIIKKQVVIPHGKIQIKSLEEKSMAPNKIKIVDILVEPNITPAFFSFQFDQTLHRLKADNSITSWLYLALLHGATSQILPDPFLIELNGIEMSLYLLQSACCWSCKPLNTESKQILAQLSKLCPNRNYYPEHLKQMQKVNWSNEIYDDIKSTCSNEAFVEISKKILQDSEKLSFVFENLNDFNYKKIDDKIILNKTNKFLSCRAYHRLAKYCPSTERLDYLFINGPMISKEKISKEIKPKNILNIKKIAINFRLLSFNIDKSFSLIKSLFSKGLELKWKKNSLASNFLFIENTPKIFYWFHKDEDDIRNLFDQNWFELFKLSKKLFENDLRNKESKINLTLLLSYFAYKNILLDDLIFFQLVNKHKLKFANFQIEEVNFLTKNGIEYKDYEIKGFLDRFFLSESSYNSIFRTYYQRNNLSSYELTKLYNEEKNEIVKNNECNIKYNNFNLINSDCFERSPIDDIKYLCKSWSDNNKLHLFLYNLEKAALNLGTTEIHKQSQIFFQNNVFFLKPEHKNKSIIFNLKHNGYQTIRDKAYHNLNSNDQQELISIHKPERFPLFGEDNLKKQYLDELSYSWYYYLNKTKAHEDRTTSYDDLNELTERLIGLNNDIAKVSGLIKENVDVLNLNEKAKSCLHNSNLWPRFSTSIILFRHLLDSDVDNTISHSSSENQKNFNDLICSLAVLYSLKNRMIRCIKYLKMGDKNDHHLIIKEMNNKPFSNWSPASFPEWVLLELEMNITIRKTQIDVAKTMINPPFDNNKMVMQLNMGEGKTSVIIPLLIAHLTNQATSKTKNLVRVFILKALFNSNFSHFSYALGGLLNKRLYIFPFSRDLEINDAKIKIYQDLIEECRLGKHFILTLPEYHLSLVLKTIELCNNYDKHKTLADKCMQLRNYLEYKCKDILDESDEILKAKYQIIYSIGKQSNLDGEKLRWDVVQDVLHLSQKHLNNLKTNFNDSIEFYQEDNNLKQTKYPLIRLLNKEPFKNLCELICDDFLNRNGIKTHIVELREEEKNYIKEYLLNDSISNEIQIFLKDSLKDKNLKDVIYLLRGWLNYELLYLILNKRWIVDYGVNKLSKRLLQAVPYRAKDVPAERAQFAHCDLAIGLTHLSYYYSGLNNEQLEEVFKSLNKANIEEAANIYDSWVQNLNLLEPSIKYFKNVNLADSTFKYQKLFPLFRQNYLTINYWLSEYLFPKEMKEFESRLSMSAWDLCSMNNNLIVGFSGTNDSKQLLPNEMNYFDLPELLGTNGQVLANLLKSAKHKVYDLAFDASNDELQMLEKLTKDGIRVLLDVGALIIKLKNQDVARYWLEIALKQKIDIEAVVYFDCKNNLIVLDKFTNRTSSFEVSIYKQNLEKCLVYLDESHCRGTDLKIPFNTTAAVTLGKDLTKDRLMQACMRMRLLGNGHYISFYASNEVNNFILKRNNISKRICLSDVIEWSIENTLRQIEGDFFHWAIQGFAYYKRDFALQNFRKDSNRDQYFSNCIENYSNRLDLIYGIERMECKVTKIIQNKFNIIAKTLNFSFKTDFEDRANKIIKKLESLIPNAKKFFHKLNVDEEIEVEYEIEQEEEVEICRPSKAKYLLSKLDDDIKIFVEKGIFKKNSKSILSLTETLENHLLLQNIKMKVNAGHLIFSRREILAKQWRHFQLGMTTIYPNHDG